MLDCFNHLFPDKQNKESAKEKISRLIEELKKYLKEVFKAEVKKACTSLKKDKVSFVSSEYIRQKADFRHYRIIKMLYDF